MESPDHQEAIADFIKAASAEISAGEHLPKSLKNDHRKSEKNSAGTLVETGMLNGKPSASYGAKGKNKNKKKKGFRNVKIQNILSEDVVSGIRMAVIDSSYPDVELCQKQAHLIQSKLVAAIDEVTNEASPKFQQTKFELGILWITCADQTTKEWLQRTVPNLQGLWEEAPLAVVEDKDLSKCTQFTVWISETVEEEVIRSRLGKQNNDLATENWLLMKRRVKERGQTLVYSVDEQSAKALKQLNFKPYYNLGRVTFQKSGVEYKYHGDQAASQ